MASVSRPEWCSTSACGSGTIAFESCVCWVMFSSITSMLWFSAERRWLAMLLCGQPAWPVSAALNAVPGARTVQVQLRLKVVRLKVVRVVSVSRLTSMLCFSAERRWLVVLLCVLDSSPIGVTEPECYLQRLCYSGFLGAFACVFVLVFVCVCVVFGLCCVYSFRTCACFCLQVQFSVVVVPTYE
jgi:hypothetical protein